MKMNTNINSNLTQMSPSWYTSVYWAWSQL